MMIVAAIGSSSEARPGVGVTLCDPSQQPITQRYSKLPPTWRRSRRSRKRRICRWKKLQGMGCNRRRFWAAHSLWVETFKVLPILSRISSFYLCSIEYICLPALKRVVFMKDNATDHCELISARNKKPYWIETNYWRRNVMNARFIWWMKI